MLSVLAAFYFYRGRIRTQAEESGVTIQRFNAIERFAHWVTATSFIILAITGLNYVFGKRLLMPLIGPDAFSTWSQRSEEHTSELQSLMRISYAVFCLQKKNTKQQTSKKI